MTIEALIEGENYHLGIFDKTLLVDGIFKPINSIEELVNGERYCFAGWCEERGFVLMEFKCPDEDQIIEAGCVVNSGLEIRLLPIQ